MLIDEEHRFEAAEGSQVGAGERISAPADGSVVHVEVFRAECVGALILGRPRPLSGHRRAGPPRDVRYTLIWEEPPIDAVRRRRRRRAGGSAGDALERILNAGIDLAHAERAGYPLDEAELMALDRCDEIGGVRGIVAAEYGDPYPRDPQAPDDPGDPRWDF
ncbi:hypothetical protein [Acidipropionibacterium acidipropionici]|nr:hypothetical protein [Acidipropionibacterium acidipropionici]